VDLTQVISKYIGETEKNLERVFAAAALAQAVLLFDEADALFGKRTDAADSRDPFINAEVGYLLKRIENFDGLAILASNANRSTVAALARRFGFVVDLAVSS
jgi:SpoVK/Ycf46/Vps4 family AAA+-type ATPase